jgi:hypothetical protein
VDNICKPFFSPESIIDFDLNDSGRLLKPNYVISLPQANFYFRLDQTLNEHFGHFWVGIGDHFNPHFLGLR